MFKYIQWWLYRRHCRSFVDGDCLILLEEVFSCPWECNYKTCPRLGTDEEWEIIKSGHLPQRYKKNWDKKG
jgi:hypothetical protein